MTKYTEARKTANKNWDSRNLDRISIAMPKGRKDAIKSHAKGCGESVNAFINRAIMEVTEMDRMHRAYQRSLLRHLEYMAEALDSGNINTVKAILADLIEDTRADIFEQEK